MPGPIMQVRKAIVKESKSQRKPFHSEPHLSHKFAFVKVVRHEHHDRLRAEYEVQHARPVNGQQRRQMAADEVNVDQVLHRGVTFQRNAQLLPAGATSML